MINLTIKRTFDLVLSVVLLLLLSPILVLIGFTIKLDSKGSVFFKQERIGKHQKPFMIFKFRTMVLNAEELGSLRTAENDPRITRFGKFLRKYSIDELPQLINIMLGQMSMVGPRPAVREHLQKYTENDYKRFKMRPGITGLAQVKGRNSIPLIKRLEYDLEYINNFDLLLDLKILIRSFIVVLKSDDVYFRQDINQNK